MPNDTPDWASASAFTSTFIDFQAWTGTSAAFAYPVEQYGSLVILLGGPATSLELTLVYSDITGAFLGQDHITNQDAATPEYILPVNCATMTVTGVSVGGQGNFRITGTDRSVMAGRFGSECIMPRELGFTGAVVANTFQILHQTDGYNNWTMLNGLMSISVVSVATVGRLWVQFATRSGAVTSFPVLEMLTAAKYTLGQINHPLTVCKWGYVPTTTNAAETIALNLLPQGGF